MNICGYEPTDFVNGEGVRCTLWVSGCSHKCKGCFNQKAWSYSYGSSFTDEYKLGVLLDLGRPFVRGLSVLGGEPLDPQNITEVTSFLESVRSRFSDTKDIMLWTGYLFEEIPAEIKRLVDKIVDGKYIEGLETRKKFRGSNNQRLWEKKSNHWYQID